MAVHRIHDRAEMLLQRIAAATGKKPAQILGELVVDFAAGLTFEDDPVLEHMTEDEIRDAITLQTHGADPMGDHHGRNV